MSVSSSSLVPDELCSEIHRLPSPLKFPSNPLASDYNTLVERVKQVFYQVASRADTASDSGPMPLSEESDSTPLPDSEDSPSDCPFTPTLSMLSEVSAAADDSITSVRASQSAAQSRSGNSRSHHSDFLRSLLAAWPSSSATPCSARPSLPENESPHEPSSMNYSEGRFFPDAYVPDVTGSPVSSAYELSGKLLYENARELADLYYDDEDEDDDLDNEEAGSEVEEGEEYMSPAIYVPLDLRPIAVPEMNGLPRPRGHHLESTTISSHSDAASMVKQEIMYNAHRGSTRESAFPIPQQQTPSAKRRCFVDPLLRVKSAPTASTPKCPRDPQTLERQLWWPPELKPLSLNIPAVPAALECPGSARVATPQVSQGVVCGRLTRWGVTNLEWVPTHKNEYRDALPLCSILRPEGAVLRARWGKETADLFRIYNRVRLKAT